MTYYEQGFVKRATELGVDGQSLLKYAAFKLKYNKRGITQEKVLELLRRAVKSRGRGAYRAFEAADNIERAVAKGKLPYKRQDELIRSSHLSQALRELVRDNGIKSVESGVKTLESVPQARFGEPETILQWASRVLRQKPPTTDDLTIPNHLMNAGRYLREAFGVK